MKKFIIFITTMALFIGASSAAVRGTDSLLRTNSAPLTATRDASVVSRTATNITPRNATTTRATGNTSVRARASTHGTNTSSRALDLRNNNRGNTNTSRPSRASTTQIARGALTTNLKDIPTNTFNIQQNECQDAYFACMDQFCATANDKYRRCICSSRLDTIKARERVLDQTADQLTDFKNLNIEAILKTPAEVKAMLTASEGELKLTKTRDNSDASKKLTAISDVLAGTRSNALSTAGQLDIGGDIKQIWNTTDLISGANIANLTGESLYNAVHSQCAELVAQRCPSQKTLNMVVSAYGMYIENDCTIILSNLDKQSKNASTAIRQTNREMNMARLENYDAHNATSINDCVAGVRETITADTACGANYVHCLDLTGLYLNRATGEPIYSENFYKLNDQVSLSGDVLTNPTNAKLVAELNKKKKFAEKTLETCRDISDSVWDEFMRQAITEIYQGTQSKIRQVKNECMDVVNQCYDEKTKQLRDYSNIEEQMLLGDRLVLSEKMCSEKLATCSNLYGGGPAGLQLLVDEMRNITDQKIAQNCLATLQDYSKKLCRAPANDMHEYPYGCRTYTPGDILYAQNPMCSATPETTDYHIKPTSQGLLDDISPLITIDQLDRYTCWENRIYTSCKPGYFLANNKCYVCPQGWSCAGNTYSPRPGSDICSPDYMASLYKKMVDYALQYCTRPSDDESTSIIPTEVLANVNTVIDSIKKDMATVLSAECEKLGGTWSTTYQTNENGEPEGKLMDFYNATNANLGWGLCHEP